MWIQLGSEYVNLAHVVRIRINKGWKNGQEEIVAELESQIKGEVQVFSRYRGRDAEILRTFMNFLSTRSADEELLPGQLPAPAAAGGGEAPSSSRNTLHDVKI